MTHDGVKEAFNQSSSINITVMHYLCIICVSVIGMYDKLLLLTLLQ
jgi:hypothetical protein